MVSKVQKWGNSLGIRIPKALAEQLGVHAGTPVEFLVREGELVLRPSSEEIVTLDELVAGITEENRHDEVQAGPPAGNEAW